VSASPTAPPQQAVPRWAELAHFGYWLRAVSPGWKWGWRHLVHIRGVLDKVTAGSVKRLALFVPPQHGKSSMTTVRYPVWRLERDPALRVGIACYNQRHANRFSRRALKIAQARRLPLDPKRQAAEEWETTAGGGFLAVGVGSGITGNPVDLLVIDDPVKNREEAESEAYRERVWDWYADDLYTRLQPGAAVVLIMTRWHTDDLAGRILGGSDAPDWAVVNLPAEAEENDPLGREPGEPLCPERFGRGDLEARKRVLGPGYSALYQQRPVPRGGGMFKREWFRQLASAVPQGCSFVRYWDKAGTAGGAGAATAGVLMACDHGGAFYVADVVRGRWAATEREGRIRETAEADARRHGDVKIYVEQEPGSGGKESAEATVRNLAGFAVYADRPTGDKTTRAEPFAAQAGAGNVRMVAGDWNQDYVNELATFPAGRLRDQVDASSGAFNKLAVAPDWDEFARRANRPDRPGTAAGRRLITGAMPRF
jgi:predicted phage terminase large subunit-like protein